jgi:hypothetical protein
VHCWHGRCTQARPISSCTTHIGPANDQTNDLCPNQKRPPTPARIFVDHRDLCRRNPYNEKRGSSGNEKVTIGLSVARILLARALADINTLHRRSESIHHVAHFDCVAINLNTRSHCSTDWTQLSKFADNIFSPTGTLVCTPPLNERRDSRSFGFNSILTLQ